MTFSSQAGLATLAALAVPVPVKVTPLIIPSILSPDAITSVPNVELAA